MMAVAMKNVEMATAKIAATKRFAVCELLNMVGFLSFISSSKIISLVALGNAGRVPVLKNRRNLPFFVFRGFSQLFTTTNSW